MFEDSERSFFSEGESQSEDGGSDNSDAEPSFDSEAENQPPRRTTGAAAAGKGKKAAAGERAGWRAAGGRTVWLAGAFGSKHQGGGLLSEAGIRAAAVGRLCCGQNQGPGGAPGGAISGATTPRALLLQEHSCRAQAMHPRLQPTSGSFP